jgi:hypothetical protein
VADIGLVSIIHDPEGRMVQAVERSFPELRSWYAAMSVIATPSSDAAAGLLRTFGVEVQDTASARVGTSRRKALELGMDHSQLEFFHYCDFDRLLHWFIYHPDELRQTLDVLPGYDFLVLGRTARAFESHPRAQIETERITNLVFSLVFGKDMDVTAGACGISRRAAELILSHSQALSNDTDTEWPLIVSTLADNKLRIGYKQNQGLEFETADYYGERVFLDAESQDNWYNRVRICRESVEAAVRLRGMGRDIAGGEG